MVGERVAFKVRVLKEFDDGLVSAAVPGFSSRIRIPKTRQTKPGKWVPIKGEVIFIYDDGRRVVELDSGPKVTIPADALEIA